MRSIRPSYNALEVNGDPYESWGIPPDTPMFEPEILTGRWLEPSDEGKPVAVFGRALAETAGLDIGNVVSVGTARGTADVEVVGIDGRAHEQRHHGLLAAHHIPDSCWGAATPTRSG